MRLHRFFVEEKINDRDGLKIKDDNLVHQWRSVLRFQVGQDVILFDNSGNEYLATISELTNREADVLIKGSQSRPSPKLSLNLCLSLTKRNSFEWALEKGTEIGVSVFSPIISQRSEIKKINQDRSKKILKESAEQSGRVFLPEILPPVSLDEYLKDFSGQTIALDPTGKPIEVSKYKDLERLNVLIGPEGGFSPEEVELFNQKNIPIVSVGDQILRAETAVVAISSLLLLS